MDLDTHALVTDVAKRWGIILSEDDPIIAVVALNDAVMEQHTDRLEKANKALESHLERVIGKQVEQSREIAKIVVGEALLQATREINAESDKALQAITLAHQKNTEALGMGIKQRESLQRSAFIGWTVATLSTLGILVLLIGFT